MILSKLSIRNKIITIILFVSLITVILGSVFVLVNFKNTYREEMLNNTIMNTKLIGEYCIGPLSFNRQEAAEEILSRLDTISYIKSGALYDENNVLFASYRRDDKFEVPSVLQKREEKYKFTDSQIEVFHPIIFKDVRYGTLVINVTTEVIQDKTRNQFFLLLIRLVVLFVLAFVLAAWAQRIISRPIIKLEKFTRKIAKTNDYSLRIRTESKDEIGHLYDAFNKMLDQIQHRQKARDEAEKHMIEAKEKAEESDRLKSAFLANMSHEIRTPLNAILGFSELLVAPENTISKGEKDQYFKLIFNSGNNLLKLMDDIIDISKIESDQIVLREKPCRIKLVINELLEHYQEILTLKNKKHITLEIDEGSCKKDITFITDRYRFKQIYSNLLDNAVKFTEKGTIKFGYKISEDDQLLFYVKDTGIGIEKRYSSLIFNRFRKVEQNSTKLYRGAGLGLTISKYLAEYLGGSIWVESESNAGSVFYFTLPYKTSEKEEYGETGDALTTKEFNWREKTILIVEDEPANLKYIEELLKPTLINIIPAYNGTEALEKVKTNSVDLVLMDLKMPGMDGFETTEEIRKMAPGVPILAQTAYSFNEEEEKAREYGMSEFISKPISSDKFIRIIAGYLQKS